MGIIPFPPGDDNGGARRISQLDLLLGYGEQ